MMNTVNYLNDRNKREDNMNQGKNMKIELNKEYFIQIYPNKEVVKGTLIIDGDVGYLFKSGTYDVLVRKDLAVIENGIVTHRKGSLESITKQESGKN